MRKLLPDGSEMYGALSPKPGAAGDDRSVVARVLGDALESPLAIFERLRTNLGRVRTVIGWPLFALFLVTSVSPLVQRARSQIPSRRFMLPLFVWTYLFGISVVTDALDRYVVVIVPFLVIQCAAEVFALAAFVSARRFAATAATIGLVGAAFVARPLHYGLVPLKRMPIEELQPYAQLRAKFPPGASVLSVSQLDALLLGANFRALPNATVDQIARYARKTDVEWLVVAGLGHNRHQVNLYEYRWYLLPSRVRDALIGRWFAKRAQTDDGRYTLYQLRRAARPEVEDG